MRRACFVFLALCAALLLASPAFAQRQQGQRGGGFGQGGIGGLLQNESVQKELKLEQAQIDKVKEVVTKVQDNHKDDFAKLRDLAQDERRTKGQELNQTVSEEVLKGVGDILNADQIKRLKQIQLQQEGSRAFAKPDIQKALNLTDEQKEKIKTITDDAAKEMAALFQGGRQQQGNREKLAALRKDTQDKVLAVLTDEQKTTWKGMTGDAFEVVRTRRQPNP
jgi:Spy/CpxP family protein refolding chaperone